jgi:hypothetical protein
MAVETGVTQAVCNGFVMFTDPGRYQNADLGVM